MTNAIHKLKWNEVETEILKRTLAERKLELKSPITQIQNSRKNLTNRMNQTEHRIPGCKDKEED